VITKEIIEERKLFNNIYIDALRKRSSMTLIPWKIS
jgi:hypothetical protein